MLLVLKRTVSMRRFFEHPKHMFKLLSTEINVFLGAQTIHIMTYVLGVQCNYLNLQYCNHTAREREGEGERGMFA